MPDFTIPLKRVVQLRQDTYRFGESHDTDGYKLGLNRYPIYDFASRPALNRKIIEHYYNQEIGVESVDMFVFNLGRKMVEIMPYWNQIYRSTQLEFDPLSTYDLATIREDEGTEANTATANSTATSATASSARTVNSDTPQTMLAGNEDYASGATDANSAGNATQNGANNSQGNTTSNANSNSTIKGRQGSGSALLTQYRQTILNTDMLVIEQLQELFMIVQNSGDNYSDYRSGLYW